MTLDELIARWRLPPQFYDELRMVLTASDVPDGDKLDPKSEAAVANECRLLGSKVGLVTWRNNVGVLQDVTGRPVRYGLANDSKHSNLVLKSGDDIGILPHVVVPQDIGRTLGVFVSIEHKRRSWTYSGKGREGPQKAWQDGVNSFGGVGMFANSAQCVIDRLVNERLLSPEQLKGLHV